ncbi:MAG: winged helix-turn-helix domain-containing protein [Candidatus Entotheonellia bacterium]
MPSGKQWCFGPFRFDPANATLWQGPQATRLTPTACALLQALLAQAGQVVTKDALLSTVWPDVAVSESTLKTYIWQLRRAFGDDPRAPRSLETVHRLGYRFCVPVAVPDGAAAPLASAPASVPSREGFARRISRRRDCSSTSFPIRPGHPSSPHTSLLGP